MANEHDSRPLRALPNVTIAMVDARLTSVETDVTDVKVAVARVETNVALLAQLAEEDREERRVERGVSLQRRAATENLEGQVKLERVRGRNKIMLAILSLLGTGGLIGALVSKLAGCA